MRKLGYTVEASNPIPGEWHVNITDPDGKACTRTAYGIDYDYVHYGNKRYTVYASSERRAKAVIRRMIRDLENWRQHELRDIKVTMEF